MKEIQEQITILYRNIGREDVTTLEAESARIWKQIRALPREIDREELYDRLVGLDVKIKAIKEGDK